MRREQFFKIDIGENKSIVESNEINMLKVLMQRRSGENLKQLVRDRSNLKICVPQEFFEAHKNLY
jgi:hypothetical protein